MLLNSPGDSTLQWDAGRDLPHLAALVVIFLYFPIIIIFAKWERTNPFSAWADERQRNGDDVDSQLKLQELGDTVVHVATPDDRFHDTRKVVVKQYDVRRFLGNVGAADALHNNDQNAMLTKRTTWSLLTRQKSTCMYVHAFTNLFADLS